MRVPLRQHGQVDVVEQRPIFGTTLPEVHRGCSSPVGSGANIHCGSSMPSTVVFFWLGLDHERLVQRSCVLYAGSLESSVFALCDRGGAVEAPLGPDRKETIVT